MTGARSKSGGKMEKKMLIDIAMENLPSKDRRVVVLYFYHKQSKQYIADLMGVHRETIRSRIKRATKKIAKMVDMFSKKI